MQQIFAQVILKKQLSVILTVD